MKAGELHETITIQRATSVSDGMGGEDVTWAPVLACRAKVLPVKGREAQHMGRTVSIETYLLVIRYGHTVLTTDRIVWRGRTLNVTSVQDRDSDRRWLTIECEAGRGTS